MSSFSVSHACRMIMYFWKKLGLVLGCHILESTIAFCKRFAEIILLLCLSFTWKFLFLLLANFMRLMLQTLKSLDHLIHVCCQYFTGN